MKNKLKNLPISAVVVTFNEERYLKKCLESISFCQEIIVFDLGSTDESINISNKYATKVIHHDRVPFVEIIHANLKNLTEFDWLLLIDPDEVLDNNLQLNILNNFHLHQDNQELGIIRVNWVFYLKERKLNGTTWGGISTRPLIYHQKRVSFLPLVHFGKRLKDNSTEIVLTSNDKEVIHHYWMSSYSQLIKKHLRYLKHEGKAQYNLGKRTSRKHIVKNIYLSFIFSFWSKKGFKDGFRGFLLSIFWCFYSTIREIKILQYQLKKNNSSADQKF